MTDEYKINNIKYTTGKQEKLGNWRNWETGETGKLEGNLRET
jgi:hypothetical protein